MLVTPPSGETHVGPDGLPPTQHSGVSGSDPRPPELPEYDLLEILGRGGMGVIYLARHRLSGRLEALKIMADRGSSDRFLREVRAAARLSHPNVVSMYGAWQDGNRIVLAMEYIDGQDLYRVVTEGGPLPVAEACEYVRQAALGLQHAAERAVVHRDVKPHNLILARTPGPGAVKVADFGLAQAAADRPTDPERTPDFLAVGTPGYMSPEQAAAAPQADTRSDVYGLGCTLYFLLTGSHPFGTGTAREICLRQRHGKPPPIQSGRSDVPDDLVCVLDRMMAANPADRYPTPGAAADALAPFAPPARTRPEGRRPRRAIRAVTAAGLLAGVAAATLHFAGTEADREPHTATTRKVDSDDDRFVPLFRGTDLTGWMVDGGNASEWRVEGGAIVTTAIRRGPRTWLLTERDYGDAVFCFEYQLDAGANTGFAFRAVPGERPVLNPDRTPTSVPYHQQIEISDDSLLDWARLPTGQVNGAARSSGPSLKPIRSIPHRPVGAWHAARIEFRKQVVRMWVDDVLVQDTDLDKLVALGSPFPALKRPSGRVGFQQSAGTVRFRALAVREELP